MKSIPKAILSISIIFFISAQNIQPAQMSTLSSAAKSNITGELLRKGAGNFNYTASHNKQIPVWYYAPVEINLNTPVLFVMHGVERNAQKYRDHWIKNAEKLKLLLLAPEFSQKFFPESNQYNLGNMYSSIKHMNQNHRSEWSFSIIEDIFDYVRAHSVIRTDSYSIYGHSAGAQFVHRMLLFVPEARIKTAIAANAGWYTMPSFDESFPYGLKGTGLTNDQVEKAFKKKLIILLGEKDTDEKSENLRQTPESIAQGRNRFERGKAFFRIAKQSASAFKSQFNWELNIVPGVGHNNSEMAREAVYYLNY